MVRCQYRLAIGLFTSAMSVVLFALLEHLNHFSNHCGRRASSDNSRNGANLFICHSPPTTQSSGFLLIFVDLLWTCLTSLPTGLVIVVLQVIEAVLEIRKKKHPTLFVRALAFIVHLAIAIGLALSHQKPSDGLQTAPSGWSLLTWTFFVAAAICILHLLMFALLWKPKKKQELRVRTMPMGRVLPRPFDPTHYQPLATEPQSGEEMKATKGDNIQDSLGEEVSTPKDPSDVFYETDEDSFA
ncbi:hypothetical protein QR680_016748 [Steinernema hermaphroditum]|uniref:Transmembrane protein n=1 Tax=Steinernema hermaphroditum TaxID=289476 RepID=A0AA39HEL8_9BILA|nr:hypothetical protein QR680_016748 [Steinernema hermaphroditum]